MIMKRYIYILIVTALFAVSCSENFNGTDIPGADYASVSLSSSSAVVSAEAQVKSVFVASNRADLDIECNADWVGVSIEGDALHLYLDENTLSNSRLAVIDVIAGTKPDVAKVRLKILQQGKHEDNLSKIGNANCYIAKCGASYRFDASVKGNGKGDGNSRYIAKYGLELNGGSYAMLAWESTYDGDKTRSTKIIDGEPIYNAESGEIHFTTGDMEGNALIALCNAYGDILWSWHIWVMNEELGVVPSRDLVWTDRNLGALTNEVGNISNRGMLYQWGRKDPFLPSPVEYMKLPRHRYDENYNLLEDEAEYNRVQSEIEQIRAIVNQNNTQTGNGVLRWNYVGNEAPIAINAPGNLEFSVQNPTMILACRTDIAIGEYVFDWYLLQDLQNSIGVMQQSQSLLWGDAEQGSDYKSIFDPCPVGYAVPPRNAFGQINSDYACTYLSEDWTLADYGWQWSGGNKSYFPSSGNLDVSGLIGETGEKILYWTAETFGAEGFGKSATLFEAYNDIYYGIYPLLDPAEAGAWYSYGARCFAAPVRCVKE